MIQPRPTPPNWLRQASSTRRWVLAIAEREGVSPRVIADRYPTPRALTRPVAAILRAYCHNEAVRMVREDREAPTGDDLLDATIARYMARYAAIKADFEKAQADAAVAEYRAMTGKG